MLFYYLKVAIKNVNKSSTLTRKEKNIIIVLGVIETLINCYKRVLVLPLTVVGLCATLVNACLSTMADLFDLISCSLLDVQEYIIKHLPSVDLTHKTRAMHKLHKELQDKR